MTWLRSRVETLAFSSLESSREQISDGFSKLESWESCIFVLSILLDTDVDLVKPVCQIKRKLILQKECVSIQNNRFQQS